MMLFGNQLLNGLSQGASYGLFGISFGLVFATMGVLNVALGAYATLGAIFGYWTALYVYHSIFLAVAGGMLGAALIAGLVDWTILDRVRNRTNDTFGSQFVACIGVWLVIYSTANHATGNQVISYPADVATGGLLHPIGLTISVIQLAEIAALAVGGWGLHWWLKSTRQGSAARAVGFNPTAAALSGVDARTIFLMLATISGAMAGVAAVLAGAAESNVSVALGQDLLLKGFAAVIIGGFGNIPGTAVAGLGIGVSEVFFAQYVSTGYSDALTFGFLLIFLLFRPEGLFKQSYRLRA